MIVVDMNQFPDYRPYNDPTNAPPPSETPNQIRGSTVKNGVGGGAQLPASEELARRFHEAYERLAPQFGYQTRRESAVQWSEIPEYQRRLMIAVAGEILASLRSHDAA